MGEQIESLLFQADVEALENLARFDELGGLFVNIGAYTGGSAAVMAMANPKLTVLVVDTFEGLEDATGKRGDELRDQCVKNLCGLPNVVCLQCDSVAAAGMVCTEVDAVFVDGNHTREGCKRDLDAWWPKIRSGGVLCGHDCVDSCGVPAALSDFCAENGVDKVELVENSHGFFLMRKP